MYVTREKITYSMCHNLLVISAFIYILILSGFMYNVYMFFVVTGALEAKRENKLHVVLKIRLFCEIL